LPHFDAKKQGKISWDGVGVVGCPLDNISLSANAEKARGQGPTSSELLRKILGRFHIL